MSDETCEYGNLVTCARCLREAGLPAMSAPGADPLAAIRQRAEQATPGPWVVEYMKMGHRKGSPSCREQCAAGMTPGRVYHESAEQAARQGYAETEIHEMWPRDFVSDIVGADDEHVVCNGHDYNERGYVRPVNAEFIAHAREDIPFLLKQWDTRESALRALVAQWRAKAVSHRTAAASYTGFYEEGSARFAQMHRTLADGIDAQADELERLLSGPQP